MRTKDYTRASNGNMVYQVHTDPPSTVTVVSDGNFFHREDDVTPGYRKRKRPAPPLQTNHFLHAGGKYRNWNGSIGWSDGIYQHTVTGVISGSMFSGVAGWPLYRGNQVDDIDSLIAKVHNKNLLKIKDSKANLALAFQERKQVASLLTSFAESVIKASAAVKRGNLSVALQAFGVRTPPKKFRRNVKPPKTSKDFANIWLQLQFGWFPAYADIVGAAELLAQKHLDQRPTKVTSNSEIVYSWTDTVTGGPTNGVKQVSEVEEVYRVKSTVYFRQTSDGISHTVAQTGFSNPFLLGWEAIPLSFVLDYALTVGDYLSTLDATSGVEFVGGSVSTAFIGKIDSRISPNGAGSGLFRNYTGQAIGQRNDWRLTRDRLTGFPTGTVRLKNPVSTVHVLNVLGLARQSIGVR